MYKNFGLICLVSLYSLCVSAQNIDGDIKQSKIQGKESVKKSNFKKAVVVKEFRTQMKASNFAKAKEVIDNAFKKNNEAKSEPQLYKLKVDALNELIGAENRKIYLNQKPDTASFFNYMYELYKTGIECDSVERLLPGKANYSKAVAEKMLPYRKNLLNAGKFFYSRDYQKSFDFIDLYVQTKTADVFTLPNGDVMVNDEDDIVNVSSIAVLSAYASNNYKGVIKYLPEALNDKRLENTFLEIGSKSASELGDTIEMVNLLENGFAFYPKQLYFFMTLVKYYNSHGEYDKALEKCEKMVEMNPENRDYYFMKGKEEMFLMKYDDAIKSFTSCLKIKADDAEAYANIGNIYLTKAHEMYSSFNLKLNDPRYNEKKAHLNSVYSNAKEAFEGSRKFAENKKELWIDGLREVYFKLNKGKELRNLEKVK